jgi:hypothetical protein
MIVIKDGPEFNKIYASVAFDQWGNPLSNDIRIVDEWDDIDIPNNSLRYDANTPFNADFGNYINMIENTLWVFNNEPCKIRDTEVFMTGSGVNWMFQKGPVHIYDISKVQVKFVQDLLNKWKGSNYGEFVYNFIVKNKIQHFHLNLNEKQDSQRSLIKDKKKFIEHVNENFAQLVAKYCPDWKWTPSKVSVKNGNLIEVIPKQYIGKFLLTNIFNFKYYYVKCFVRDAYSLISPSTRSFIKNINNHQSKYDHPPCKRLDLNVPFKKINEEIRSIEQYLVPHRHESGLGWKSFCIHGQSASRTKEPEFYKNFLGYKWTDEALENMPVTINWLKSLGYKNFQRVRVMCLEPKGFINIHKDQEHSSLGPVNVAITNPKNCQFYLENHGILSFSPGRAYKLNLVNYHAVINNSNSPRYHIIIHGDK